MPFVLAKAHISHKTLVMSESLWFYFLLDRSSDQILLSSFIPVNKLSDLVVLETKLLP